PRRRRQHVCSGVPAVQALAAAYGRYTTWSAVGGRCVYAPSHQGPARTRRAADRRIYPPYHWHGRVCGDDLASAITNAVVCVDAIRRTAANVAVGSGVSAARVDGSAHRGQHAAARSAAPNANRLDAVRALGQHLQRARRLPLGILL
ncbi:hypothetical protein IWW55_007276, partial [Coemansia sp. RSA 2706]